MLETQVEAFPFHLVLSHQVRQGAHRHRVALLQRHSHLPKKELQEPSEGFLLCCRAGHHFSFLDRQRQLRPSETLTCRAKKRRVSFFLVGLSVRYQTTWMNVEYRREQSRWLPVCLKKQRTGLDEWDRGRLQLYYWTRCQEAGLSPHSEPSGNAHRVIGDFGWSEGGDVREHATGLHIGRERARSADVWGLFWRRGEGGLFYDVCGSE